MSLTEAMSWGVLGAAASLIIVYVIPTGLLLARGKAQPTISFWRVVGALLVLVGTLFLGGVAAIGSGSSNDKEALIAGLAYQSLVAGWMKKALGPSTGSRPRRQPAANSSRST